MSKQRTSDYVPEAPPATASYPFWAMTIIALDIFVIWALAVHGREITT